MYEGIRRRAFAIWGMLMLAASAHGALYSVTNINAIISDGNPVGYQSSQTISGTIGQITDVNVTLNLTNGYNGDLYGYLVHDSGFTVLLNRPGRDIGNSFGYGDTGFSVTLDDSAGTDIHQYQTVSYTLNGSGALTGNWQPDGRNVDPVGVTNGSPRTTSLASFNGLSANGSWTLFLADMSGGAVSTLTSWTLDVSTGCPAITIAPASLPGGSVGAAYNQTNTASGGTAPYAFIVSSGTLPTGLGLATNTGVLSGTASGGGTFNFTVTATDVYGCTRSSNYSVTISCPAITVGPGSLPDGVVGTAYSRTNTASGGNAPYTFSVISGSLPAGLSLNTNTGVISGTPTAGGVTNNFTVRATDANGCTGNQAYTVTVSCPAIMVGPASLPGGTTGVAYNRTNTATGGTAAYTYAVTGGSLPGGVSLSSSGVLSGTPANANSFNFTVTATDVYGCTGSSNYSVTISCPAITVGPASLPDGVVGTVYNRTNTATGGTAAYTYAVTGGSLPAGLGLNTNTGVINGTPTTGGVTNSFTVRATDVYGCIASQSYTVAMRCPAISVGPASLPGGTAGVAYSQTNTAGGGTANYSFAVTGGSLPGGLSLSSGGILNGTPTAGTNTFTVTATDTYGCAGSTNYTLTIEAVATTNCPTLTLGDITTTAVRNSAYSHTIIASGGGSPYAFGLTAGSLPAGIALSVGGALSGIPVNAGSYNFTVTVTNASGCTGSRSYKLKVFPTATPDTTPPTVTLVYPGNNSYVTSPSLVVTGKAADNVWIDNVYYGIDGGLVTNLANGGSNWNFTFVPAAGDRTVVVQAEDLAGNTKAATNKFFYGVNSTLTILTNGNGSVVGTLNAPYGKPADGATLVVAKTYKITVKPAAGNVFSNVLHVVNGVTNILSPSYPALKGGLYQFVMATNSTLIVNFAPNRFIGAAGTYSGLFSDTSNGVSHESAGFFTLKTTALLAFSGTLKLDGSAWPFSGTFDVTGVGRLSRPEINRSAKGRSNLVVTVQLPFDGSETISGVVSNTDTTTNGWVSGLIGDRAVFKAGPATNFAGAYTLVLPGSSNSTAKPGGAGYGTVTIKTNGMAQLTGSLGDGAMLLGQAGVSVSSNGYWPFYATAYRDTVTKLYQGSVIGWVSVTNAPTNNLGGSLSWFKRAFAGNPFNYTAGFTNLGVVFKASPYTPPVGVQVIQLAGAGNSNGIIVLGGANLTTPTTNTLTLSTLNIFTIATTNTVGALNTPTLKLTAKTGLLTGSFNNPGFTSLRGVVLEQQNEGDGFFKSGVETGGFLIQGN